MREKCITETVTMEKKTKCYIEIHTSSKIVCALFFFTRKNAEIFVKRARLECSQKAAVTTTEQNVMQFVWYELLTERNLNNHILSKSKFDELTEMLNRSFEFDFFFSQLPKNTERKCIMVAANVSLVRDFWHVFLWNFGI